MAGGVAGLMAGGVAGLMAGGGLGVTLLSCDGVTFGVISSDDAPTTTIANTERAIISR